MGCRYVGHVLAAYKLEATEVECRDRLEETEVECRHKLEATKVESHKLEATKDETLTHLPF